MIEMYDYEDGNIPDVDIEKLFDKIYNNKPISKATLNRYTRSLRRYVKQIYGW